MADDVKFTGLSELRALFENLPNQLAEAGLRKAAFSGAELIANQAKDNVRSVTGTLYRAIIVKRLEEKSGRMIQTYKVCVRKGKFGGPDGYYGQWVEYGHLIRGKGNAIRGGKASKQNQRVVLAQQGAASVPAHPFMRPAYEQKGSEAVELIKSTLAERIRELTA